MPVTKYCQRCGKLHSENEMRQVQTRIGLQWRCLKSIEAQSKSTAERDAFGEQVRLANKKRLSEMASKTTKISSEV